MCCLPALARTCTSGAAAVWACGGANAGRAGSGGGEVWVSSQPPCAVPATLLLAPAELPAAAAGVRNQSVQPKVQMH